MEKSQIPVAILVRVSTAKQETARQISELRQYADGKGYEVIEVCQETISGSAEDHERDGLRRAEQLARDGKIKKVLVHEISRIARRNSVAHRFVETLEDCNVSLYWHAQSIETLLPNGKRNPAAGIMLALLAEMARNESETLRERIKSGLALARKRRAAWPPQRNNAYARAIPTQAQGHCASDSSRAFRAQYSENRWQRHIDGSAS